jgi:hypothetical protein
MSSIIGAVSKLPIAKIIDIWGRAQGYMLMVFLATLGKIGCQKGGLGSLRRQAADTQQG